MKLQRLACISFLVLFLTPAFAQSTRSTDTEKSVTTDEVYFLIPDEEDVKDDGEGREEQRDDSSSGTQSSAKGESKVSSVGSSGTMSIDNSGVMAPGGGGGGPGGGGSHEDPVHETYARQNIKEDLTPYGVDLLGEQFDLATGSLSFSQTDIIIPGNNGLEVAIRRTISTAKGLDTPDNEFGDWQLNVPRMEMMVSDQAPGLWASDRCSSWSDPGDIYHWGHWYFNYEYWNGLKMHIPGQGAQTVLDNPTSPLKTGGNVEKSTTQYWDIECSNIGGSEGFIATSPNGIKYHFTALEYRSASPIMKDFKPMGRRRAQMFATKVEDRFGNNVIYTYGSNGPTKIKASDGREITIAYGTNGKIASATVVDVAVPANNRTWTYEYYDPTSYGWDFLKKVTWPNGQYWEFNIHDLTMSEPYPGLLISSVCTTRTTADGYVIHPYGTTGTYTLTETGHGRTDVPSQTNLNSPPCHESKHIQRSFDVMSLTEKKLEGPGLPTMVWDYTYSENQGGWAGDGTNPLKTTRVDKPDGTYDIHHFNRSWSYLEGAVEKVESYSSTGGLLQKVEYDYMTGPGRGIVGELFYENLAKSQAPKHRIEAKTTRGADVFTTEYEFDTLTSSNTFSFGRPIQIDQHNNIDQTDENGGTYQNSQVVDIAYAHDKTHWELARETTQKVGSETLSENIYDTNNRVKYIKQYGVEVREFSYNSSGTVNWQEDALDNRVTLTNWKRGIPQTITYPDATTHVFIVDGNGWITKSTDANANPTEYKYDQIGRMTKVIYPKGDGINRLDKVITYGLVTGTDIAITDSGLISGQYKQTKSRGEVVATTYFDAMLRPVLARSEDSTDSELDRWTRQTFDTSNRPVFRSFPSADAKADEGTNIVFDALGRTLSATENVTPFVSTTYQYLSGNKVKVTNPRNKQTTTTYFALGSPSQESPTLIQQPESVTTTVVRNDFGEMTVAKQGDGVDSAIRRYYYNPRHLLCRQVDPETGSTAYEYNLNGQIDWYAKAASGNTNSCDTGAVLGGEKIQLAYDNMGRIETINYPDDSPDLSYDYHPNGNLWKLNSSSANWLYEYNAVNALDYEKLITDGQTFETSYDFDTQDRLEGIDYPSGLSVTIVPNAYGEPESVGSYATGIEYHPNGSIKKLDYGDIDSRVYTLSQNARQLPWVLELVDDAGTVAKHTHNYDDNGNILAILDGVSSMRNRSMTYDDLDRLETTSGYQNVGSFSYDALGNILTKNYNGDTISISYDSNNLVDDVDIDPASSAPYTNSYVHDVYGNVTDNGNHTFEYSLAGNMASSTSPAIDYYYDGHNRRVHRYENSVDIYTFYSQSGALLHKEEGGVETDYIYAGSLLVAKKVGSATHYLHTDLLGSPIEGKVGAASYTERYGPWGEKKNNPIQLADDIGFTGHQSEIQVGLTYMQARYYDPVIGRFMAADPSGMVNSFNLYSYVVNNPVNLVDPTGLACTTGVATGTDDKGQITATTTTICNDNNGVFFEPFDTPEGWEDPKGPSQRWYHIYDYESGLAVCEKALQDVLAYKPTPGKNTSPASPDGTPNNASPHPIMPDSPVKSYSGIASNGMPYILNVTQPGHKLHPGYVVRMSVPHSESNGFSVRNFGEGLAGIQSKYSLLSGPINGIWVDEGEKAAAIADALNRMNHPGCE